MTEVPPTSADIEAHIRPYISEAGSLSGSFNWHLKDFISNQDHYILYKDPSLVVVNKPAGILSHYGNTCLLGVEEVFRYTYKNPDLRVVHRLDKETSGALILTQTPEAYYNLKRQFEQKTAFGLANDSSQDNSRGEAPSLEKIYIAILDGILENDQSVRVGIEHKGKRKVVVHGQANPDQGIVDSLTYIAPNRIVTSKEGFYTIAAVQIVTGRKHQIRAVASYLGHPVTGDTLYGARRGTSMRQMLHARRITFEHPSTQEVITINAPIPNDFQYFLKLTAANKIART